MENDPPSFPTDTASPASADPAPADTAPSAPADTAPVNTADTASADAVPAGAKAPSDFGHQGWFVENEQELVERAEEQCVQCYDLFPAAECEDGLCRDCRLRGLPGRSVLEQVSATRRRVRNGLVAACLFLLLCLLLQRLFSC